MKQLILSIIISASCLTSFSQELYSKSFGNKQNPALIFLHGGPGYNCSSFEITTAEELAQHGFYVIVYDRRGEGRSIDTKAKYTFEESNNDLLNLYSKYGIQKASLIGHSFGGILATFFAEKYSGKVESLILVGAPIALQESFKNIIKQCKNIYEQKEDALNLSYLERLEQLDTASLEYSSYCFNYAMRNGFYSTKSPTEKAKKLYSLFKTDSTLRTNASKMTIEAPKGFWENEAYTTIDLSSNIESLVKKNKLIVAAYGKEDGLYSKEQIDHLQTLIGKNTLLYLDNCSHSVFIDQQEKLIELLITNCKKRPLKEDN
jgi:proline iminopeptidase